MPYIREDQAEIRVKIAGKWYGDAWADAEGADIESDDSKTRPGGQGDEVSVGGPSSRNDCTVRIQFDDVVATWHRDLETAAIDDEDALVTYQFLVKRQPIGTTHSVQGIIKSAKLPDFKASGNEVGFYTVVISCHERAV